MLGKTSLSAIRSLLLLAQQEPGACWSPRRLAEALDESPTYLAKVVRHMVKSGILDAEKGVKGGVRLARRPGEVTLLNIVEACQGMIASDFCHPVPTTHAQCAFHLAAVELHEAITSVLDRWTLAALLEKPRGKGKRGAGVPCLMGPVLEAFERTPARPGTRLVQVGGRS